MTDSSMNEDDKNVSSKLENKIVAQYGVAARLESSLRKPFMLGFIEDLIGLGANSQKQKTIVKVVLGAGLFLSLASGYTTFMGLSQYLPSVMAIIACLGIQGLLFATSWRIGQTSSEDRFNISIKVIFVFTMLASVYFSFSSLLDKIYTIDQRQKDELQITQNMAIQLNGQLMKISEDRQAKVENAIFGELTKWNEVTIDLLHGEIFNKQKTLSIARSEHERRVKYVEREESQKNQPEEYYVKLENLKSYRDNYFFKSVKPQEDELQNLQRLAGAINDIYKRIISEPEISRETVYELQSSISEVRNLVSGTSNPKQISLITPPAVNTFISNRSVSATPIGEYQILDMKSAEEIRKLMVNKILALTFSEEQDKIKFLQEIEKLNSNSGSNSHPFSMCINELNRGNVLAFGSLAMALIIDLLILFCGIIGGKPDSFLDLQDRDIAEHCELALEVILATNIFRDIKPEQAYVKRILEIFNILEPDINMASEGYPGILMISKIKEKKLTNEVGVFLALDLAVEAKNAEKIALSTRLILWMANEVVNSETRDRKIALLKETKFSTLDK